MSKQSTFKSKLSYNIDINIYRLIGSRHRHLKDIYICILAIFFDFELFIDSMNTRNPLFPNFEFIHLS